MSRIYKWKNNSEVYIATFYISLPSEAVIKSVLKLLWVFWNCSFSYSGTYHNFLIFFFFTDLWRMYLGSTVIGESNGVNQNLNIFPTFFTYGTTHKLFSAWRQLNEA